MERFLPAVMIVFIGSVLFFFSMRFMFHYKYSRFISVLIEIGCILTLMLLNVGLQLINQPVILSWVLCSLIILLLIPFLFQEKILIILPISLLLLISFFVSFRLVQSSLSDSYDMQSIRGLLLYGLILLFTSFLFDSSIVIAVRGLTPYRDRFGFQPIWLVYLLFPVCQFILIDRTLIAGSGMVNNDQLIYLYLSILFSLVTDIALLAAIRSISNGIDLRTRFEALDREVALQANYYQQVTQYYEHLRQLRHDLSNHVYTLQIQLHEGNLSDAVAYSKALQRENQLLEQYAFCENPVVDLFLSQTAESLQKQNIHLIASLQIPRTIRIKSGDLVCAIGTLIDRAIPHRDSDSRIEYRLSATYEDGVLSLISSIPSSAGSVIDEASGALLQRIAVRYNGSFCCLQKDQEMQDTLVLHEEVSK